MTSILIVEDDEQLRSAVARDLVHRGFSVTTVESVDDALGKLRQHGFDVLLTDLRMGERDGIDLLAALPDVAPTTPAILMSAYASARDHQRAIELGAVQVLCKPFTSVELAQAIRKAMECETGFRGTLHGISLVDVLQMFHLSRRSVCLTVGGRTGGAIHVREGEIVHAVQGNSVGEEALRSILGVPSGSIRTAPLESEQRSIERTFQGLLLDMLRGLDEEQKDDFGDFEDGLSATARTVRRSVVPSAADAAGLCAEVVARVEGALICGVVELASARLVGVHRAATSDGKRRDDLVTVAVDLFRTAGLHELERQLAAELGQTEGDEPAYREARVLLRDEVRLMLTTHDGEKAVVLVARPETSSGLAFWHLRACIPAFERAL